MQLLQLHVNKASRREGGTHLLPVGIHQAEGVGLAVNVNAHNERIGHDSVPGARIHVHPRSRILASGEINSLVVNESLWLSVEVSPRLLLRPSGSDKTSFE